MPVLLKTFLLERNLIIVHRILIYMLLICKELHINNNND